MRVNEQIFTGSARTVASNGFVVYFVYKGNKCLLRHVNVSKTALLMQCTGSQGSGTPGIGLPRNPGLGLEPGLAVLATQNKLCQAAGESLANPDLGTRICGLEDLGETSSLNLQRHLPK